jgi:glycosyltransferase involved in cell wall biosynthesis
VDTDKFQLQEEKDSYYVAMSRLVEYKRMDLIVQAFSEMPDKELIVIGDGPEYDRLEKAAGPNVSLLGYQPDEAVQHYMQRARAFVFAAEEDFGIVPVEAQACGTPVIAYGKGGAKETIIPDVTGIFFDEQSVESLVDAVERFEVKYNQFDHYQIRQHAEKFSAERFREELSHFVEMSYSTFLEHGMVSDDLVFGKDKALD